MKDFFITYNEYVFEQKFNSEKIDTNWEAFDKTAGGLYSSELTVIGGKVSSGKTSFILRLMLFLLKSNHTVLFFNLQNSKYNVLNKIKEIEQEYPDAEISYDKTQNLFIYHHNEIYIDDIEIAINSKLDINNKVIVFIDSLLNLTTKEHFNKSYYKINKIIRTLKNLTVKYNLPIILTAGLNRNIYNYYKNRPSISEIKGSGEIEEFADKVILMYSYDLSGITENSEGTCISGHNEIIVVKNRFYKRGAFIIKSLPSECFIDCTEEFDFTTYEKDRCTVEQNDIMF